MAVTAEGEMSGSIGGGIMEHKFVELAKEKLGKGDISCTVHLQQHDKTSTHQSGMICSGEQTNVICLLQPGDLPGIDQIIYNHAALGVAHIYFNANGLHLSVTPTPPTAKPNEQPAIAWQYELRIGGKLQLHIVGAGHCALALSHIMALLHFDIHLYDDRKDLHTYTANTAAHTKLIVEDYRQVAALISPGDYVVVMTVGYRTDDIVVRSLLHKPLAYFGVLGSQNKIEKLFATYTAEGVDAQLLQRIYAPIGIPINSQTPEEIAISIAAEIIGVKNGKGGERF